MRILIAEDDKDAGGFLKEALEREAFAVDLAHDGEAALKRARAAKYDAILLDVEMPPPDGFTVLKTLRKEGNRSAILMVTCRGNETDRLTGLNGGADDYIVKPFLIREVAARIRTVLRRTQPAGQKTDQPTVLTAGELELNLSKRRASIRGREIDLTPKEFELLDYLMRHPGEVVNKLALAQAVWNMDYGTDAHVVEVHMNNLRGKLEVDKHPLIETVHRVGYRFNPSTAKNPPKK